MRLKKAQEQIKQFITERGWDKYHTPKNLSMSMAAELGELMSLFEWMTDEQVLEAMKHQDFNKAVKGELADIFHHYLQLCNKLNIDPIEAFNEKFENSKQRFPVVAARQFDPVSWKLKKIREKKEVRLE